MQWCKVDHGQIEGITHIWWATVDAINVPGNLDHSAGTMSDISLNSQYMYMGETEFQNVKKFKKMIWVPKIRAKGITVKDMCKHLSSAGPGMKLIS